MNTGCPDCASARAQLIERDATIARQKQIIGNLREANENLTGELLGAQERINIANRRFGPGSV